MSLMSIRKINNIPYEINEQLNDANECQHRNEHSTRHDEIRCDTGPLAYLFVLGCDGETEAGFV